MASVIKPKRSSVANTPPTTSNIQQYEIAINTADKKIYTRTGSDQIITIGSGNLSGLNDVAVTSPTNGQIISYDTTTGTWINIDNYATQVKEVVKNNTGSTLVAGTVVYVSGASGANILVAKAQANAESTSSRTFGIIETDILNGELGYCVRSGRLSGLNTSAYAEGDPLYLSPTTAGGFVVGLANKPTAPYHLVYLGIVTRSQSQNGEIQISISNGWELDELHDVKITSPANGQVLSYDSALGVWKNVTPPASDAVTTITKTITLSTDWQDTGIKSTDLDTGTYIVQLIANDMGSGGTNNNEYYSGTMSWYSGTTNSALEMPTDEIVLHRAGASGEGALYLRTYRTPTADPDNLKLQIYSNTANASAANYVFKFRRMI